MLRPLFTRLMVVLVCLAPIAAGCGSDDAAGPSPPSITYELNPGTRELTAETLAAVIDTGPIDGTVHFKGAPAQLAGLKAGDILLSGESATTPDGLLRQVLEVVPDGGGTAVKTRLAPVQLAFRSLHARATTAMTQLGAPGLSTMGVYSKTEKKGAGQVIELNPYDQDGKPETKDDQLYVKGGAEGSIAVTTWIDLDWLDSPAAVLEQIGCAARFPTCTPDLPNVVFGARIEIKASIGVDAEGAASKGYATGEKKIEGSDIQLPKIKLGPVVIFPSVDFVTEVTGSAAARFRTAVSVEYGTSTELSIGTKSGLDFKPPAVPSPKFTAPTVDVSLSSTVKVAIGPRLKLLFWGSIGPTISILGYGQLRANQEQTPCWGLDTGVDANIRLLFRIPWEIFDAEEIGSFLGLDGDIINASLYKQPIFVLPNILTGSCGALPVNLYPPGDGPSDEVYRAPTFAPWSNRYLDFSTTFPVTGEPAESNIHTDKAVDGAWLVSGKGIPGALKIAESGEVRWAKKLTLPGRGEEILPNEVAKSAFAVQALDTNVWIATSRFNVMKLDPGGDLVWAKRYVPDDPLLPDAIDATGLVPLPDGGAIVQYGIEDTPQTGPVVLMRLGPTGKLLWSKTFKYETDKSFAPVLLVDGEEIIIAGNSWESGSMRAHIARMKLDGTVLWAKGLSICAASRVQPTYGVVLASKAIALVGTIDSAPARSFLAQISPDGTRVTNASWWTGSNVKDDRVNGVAQLPVTGFVSAAVGVPVNGHSLLLAHHDGQGAVISQKEYVMKDATGLWQLRSGALRMTNDGGALVFAHLATDQAASENANTGPERSGLWISKLPARTLEGSFDPAIVQPTKQDAVSITCNAELTPDTFAPTDIALKTFDVTKITKVEPLNPVVEKLIP